MSRVANGVTWVSLFSPDPNSECRNREKKASLQLQASSLSCSITLPLVQLRRTHQVQKQDAPDQQLPSPKPAQTPFSCFAQPREHVCRVHWGWRPTLPGDPSGAGMRFARSVQRYQARVRAHLLVGAVFPDRLGVGTHVSEV